MYLSLIWQLSILCFEAVVMGTDPAHDPLFFIFILFLAWLLYIFVIASVYDVCEGGNKWVRETGTFGIGIVPNNTATMYKYRWSDLLRQMRYDWYELWGGFYILYCIWEV